MLQPVRRSVTTIEAGVHVVTDGLREGAERGRTVHPPHGEDHGDGNQWGEPLVSWKDDGKARAVSRS